MGFGLRAALNARLVRENRRAAPRHQYVANETWIRLEGCLARLCQVLDHSRTGVRLALANAHSFPDTFTLILSKNSGGSRLARVKWCRGGELGAEFLNADLAAVSRSPADAPRTNLSSPSRSTVDARANNSSSASRLTTSAPGAVKPHNAEGEKAGNAMSSLSSRTPTQLSGIAKPKAALGSIGSDQMNSQADRQTTYDGGRVDRADQGKNSKKRMDLSRLQKKLGPKHVALLDALKDLDPESPNGRELASIIESLDKRGDSQRTI
jgi:hypothetical protein